jgi:hypothetical protein
MRGMLLALLLAGTVGGCVGAGVMPGNGSQSNAGVLPGNDSQSDGGGGQVLAAIGTPFLIVAKVPVCVLTLVVAGPAAAVNELSEDDNSLGQEVNQSLADGIDRNCGPPYAISP